MPDRPEDRLDSWKEIAAYLARGVRTVRRWEVEEGLPVHRHVHHAAGTVYAYKSEIEGWRRAGPRVPADVANSIAVLPFTNLSSEQDNQYFADGLTDEITADLSKVRALRVISRTSAMTFKGTAKDVKTIARELGVRYILEGSVRRAGTRLRITARLIDAATDHHLWADAYDGSVEDVFAIQERLARVIVSALALRLTADEDRRLNERAVRNLHAYECYLRARQEAFRWRSDAIDHAIRLLHNGLTITGDNAGLYAAMGIAYLQYREAGIDFGERPLAEAEACARKVFALEPGSSAGMQLRGWIHYGRGRIQEAVRDLKAALEVEANNADSLLLLANCYLISGRVTVARPLIERILAIDPLTPLSRCMPAFADVMEGRFETTLEPYRQMFEMDPANPMARLFYVWVLGLNNRTDEIAAIADAFPADLRDTVPGRLALLLAAAHAGKTVEAGALLSTNMEPPTIGGDVFPRMLAHSYALAGMPDRAMRWLVIAVDRGFINYPFLADYDPSLVSLRALPQFRELMDVVRSRWETFEV